MTVKSYRILLVSMVLLLLGIGIIYGINITKDSSLVKKDVEDNIIKEDIDMVYEQKIDETLVKYEEDFKVILQRNYTLCSHVLQEEKMEFNTSSDLIKEKYKEYSFVEQTDEYIKFEATINSNCPNHFLLKILNEHIVIYQVVSDEELLLHKNTEIHINRIREELLQELNKGIYVNSIDELNSIIEDMET